MHLLQIIAKILLIMFAFPALGLLSFHGGAWAGIGATLLITVIGVVITLVTLPLIVGWLLASTLGGPLGVRLAAFGISTGIYTVSLYATAGMMSSLALVGFGPTVLAAAILGIVTALLQPSRSN
jgi:hypothetical protein